MANIQQLSYPYFTDNSTALNASNLNPIIAKINELIVKVNGGSPSPTPTVSTPTITINGTSATIACATSGATIYYTTNGDTPTSSSTQYSSAITLSGKGTLKAIAIKDGTSSSVASKVYPVNLFNLFNAVWGDALNSSTGELSADKGGIVSEFIPVTANTAYTFKGFKEICWYNSSKQFISSSTDASQKTVTAPANAAYMRFSFYKAQYAPKNMIVNIGSKLGSDTDLNQTYPPSLSNLFNASTALANTGLDMNGNLVENLSAYITSDYIAVSANTDYTFYMRYNVCWYDSSKQFISADAGSTNQANKTVKSASGAAYMRFSFTSNFAASDQVVNQGDKLAVPLS